MATRTENEGDDASCWNKARVDEPMFILLGRDTSAGHAVRLWIYDRLSMGKNTSNDQQIKDAYLIASKMEEYAAGFRDA